MNKIDVHGKGGINFELHDTICFDYIYDNIKPNFDTEFIKILSDEEIKQILELLIDEQKRRR